MTERAASRTAILVCQARAVADGRSTVGRFGDPIARELLSDEERDLVDQVRAGASPTSWSAGMELGLLRATAEVIVPRTVAIDDAIRESDAPQVVIVGAGLDTRAWRMTELAGRVVFEVDHAASQEDKRSRTAEPTPVTEHLHLVSADLGTEDLAAVLDAAGHRADEQTMWVWEGVVPYLTRDEVATTVAAIGRRSAAGSRLAINYQSPSLIASFGRLALRWTARLGRRPDPMADEPQRSAWTSDAMAAQLNAQGFEVRADDDLLTLAHRLDLTPKARSSLQTGRVVIAEMAAWT